MRTLIVDDNPLLRETLRSILESLGAHVTEAADGNLALARIAEAALPFELIVCDLRMPNRDGIQFLRGIAARHIQAGIILISGHEAEVLAAAADIGRRHALNVLGHLKKPFTRKDLETLLAQTGAAVTAQPPKPFGAAEIAAVDVARGLDAGEFHAHFQPKVDSTTCRIVGVEALARWRAVPPTEFIPVAEESALIDRLTRVVLDAALDLQSQIELPVAVNLSTRSMTRLDFADELAAAVAARQAPAHAVTFEVTESRLAENMGALLETCARLRLMGFKLAIDDFGTGFSTLEQLRLLPVSELKIDRMFIASARTDPRSRHILEASLSLGGRLGMACVCEGVETRAEWDLVRAHGHHMAQGYFIARPMTAADLPNWVRDWSARSAGGTVA